MKKKILKIILSIVLILILAVEQQAVEDRLILSGRTN